MQRRGSGCINHRRFSFDTEFFLIIPSDPSETKYPVRRIFIVAFGYDFKSFACNLFAFLFRNRLIGINKFNTFYLPIPKL